MTESTSSGGTESSKVPKDVLELGEHLVRELGLEDSTDTLGRWLAHHLAELMTAVKETAGTSAHHEALRQATEIILRIWERRTALPGDAYPLAQYKEVLNVLKADLRGRQHLYSVGFGRSARPASTKEIASDLRGLAREIEMFDGLRPAKGSTAARKWTSVYLSKVELDVLSGLEEWKEAIGTVKQEQGPESNTSDPPPVRVGSLLKARLDKIIEGLKEIGSRLEVGGQEMVENKWTRTSRASSPGRANPKVSPKARVRTGTNEKP
jgi:hypothetical protein